MVEAERQGEHGGVELLLGEIQAAALGLKVVWKREQEGEKGDQLGLAMVSSCPWPW